MNHKRRVVVTGMGGITPLGNTIKDIEKNAFSGASGIKHLDLPYVDKLNCKIAAQANFTPEEFFNNKKDYLILDRIGQMALCASKQAVEDSGLDTNTIDTLKTGVYFGTGMGGINSVEDGYDTLFLKGQNRLKPYTVLMCMYNNPAAAIATEYKIAGPNLTFSTACSSSAVAIGQAMKDIRYGETDVAFAGGTDSILAYASIKSWEAIRILADEDKDVSASCKPFSSDRSGLVIGEGAAMLVLEELEHAKKRGAKIYGEVLGYGAANDFNHIANPTVEGQKITMAAAIKDADIEPSKIQYINAHGTGTKLNDEVETNAIKEVFGDHAYALSVSSTKSMHGHLMGAAGVLECMISLMAIKRNEFPPTINLKNKDPKCDLNYVANVSQKSDEVNYVMSNSFAFGGTGACLIFKKA
jgi:3-oxoacyl-[acyl-carrier-protein] synthase II